MRSNRSNRGNRVTICLTPTICFESDHFISFTNVSPCFSIRWFSLHRKMMFLSGATHELVACMVFVAHCGELLIADERSNIRVGKLVASLMKHNG